MDAHDQNLLYSCSTTIDFNAKPSDPHSSTQRVCSLCTVRCRAFVPMKRVDYETWRCPVCGLEEGMTGEGFFVKKEPRR